MKRLSLLAFALPLLFTVACTPAPRLRAPDDFARLEAHDDFLFRAASPEGVVLAVRREPNQPRGTLRFWTSMIDARLRDAGYERDGAARDTQTAQGIQGARLRFARKENGRPYRYWVSVFVVGERVYLVEAGGDADKLRGETEDAVERAMASVVLS